MKPTVISLFSGVGGLDFGFEAAGFRTAVAIEIDRTCCATLQLNRRWRILQEDIHRLSASQILSAADLQPGEPDVLIGGPPCQPFSKSGFWSTGDTGRLTDPRADTLAAYLRILRETRPRVFLLENVAGLAYRGKDEGLQLLLSGIRDLNRDCGTAYQVEVAKINAANYGVPQLRERVFLVGCRDGQAFAFPQSTHGAPADQTLFGPSVLPYRTTWDAIGDLSNLDDPSLALGGKWGDLLPSIPEGHNYLWHTDRGGGQPLFGWRRRYWSFLLKVSKRQPSWTIQAQPGPATGPFHWNNRRFSPIELCRLQTFPDGLRFACSQRDAQKMLGNAVPSLLAEVLARAISKQILRRKLQPSQPKLLPPDRGVPPEPEAVRRVPRKYSKLIGEHSAHPGTGQGWGVDNKRRAVGG